MSRSPKHKSHAAQTQDPEALAQRGRQSLQEGRFRQAREDFKTLLKIGRNEFHSDLIAANLGLFRQMLSKGQRGEAQTVLENIRQMASPEESLAAEIEWLQGEGAWERAAESLAGRLSREQPLPLPPEKIADILVLGFTTLPALENRMPELHADLERIHRALDAIAREAFGEAAAELQPIGFRSLFSEWKTALKGILAFHAGDDAAARKAFGMLRRDSACRDACRAYSALLDRKPLSVGGEGGEHATLAEGAARILGLEDLYPLLSRVDYLWSRGRYRDALLHVLETRPRLLREENGPEGWLARFLAQGPPTNDPDLVSRYFTTWVESAKLPEDQLPVFLAGTLAQEKSEDPSFIRKSWERLMQHHPRAQSSRARARIHLHMGLQALDYAKAEVAQGIPWGRRRRPDVKKLSQARQDIEESLRLEGGSLDAWHALTAVLELSEKKGDLNRHLERMADRIPDDLATQEKLALDCASRGAFGKALRYLEKARTLNPLGASLARLVVLIRVEQAQAHFRKRLADKGRQAFREALQSAPDRPSTLLGGRHWVFLHWHLAEASLGDETGAKVIRGQWEENTSPALYFAGFHLAADMKLPPQQKEFERLFADALNRPDAAAGAEDLIRFWKEWQAAPLRPYVDGLLGRRLDPLHALLSRAFIRETPEGVYRPILRHMHDTLGPFTVGRLCVRLLPWHPEDFALRCLKALSAFTSSLSTLRELRQEALDRGEKEWAKALQARLERGPVDRDFPDVSGGPGQGFPFDGILDLLKDWMEMEAQASGKKAEQPGTRRGGRGRKSSRRSEQDELPF